jgi:hypothetical protein
MDTGGFPLLPNFLLHGLVLHRHDFHLVVEDFVLLGEVLQEVLVILQRVIFTRFQVFYKSVKVNYHLTSNCEADSAVQHLLLNELNRVLKVLNREMFFVHHHDVILLYLPGYLRQVLRLLTHAAECVFDEEIREQLLERLILLAVVVLVDTQYAYLLALTRQHLILPLLLRDVQELLLYKDQDVISDPLSAHLLKIPQNVNLSEDNHWEVLHEKVDDRG